MNTWYCLNACMWFSKCRHAVSYVPQAHALPKMMILSTISGCSSLDCVSMNGCTSYDVSAEVLCSFRYSLILSYSSFSFVIAFLFIEYGMFWTYILMSQVWWKWKKSSAYLHKMKNTSAIVQLNIIQLMDRDDIIL